MENQVYINFQGVDLYHEGSFSILTLLIDTGIPTIRGSTKYQVKVYTITAYITRQNSDNCFDPVDAHLQISPFARVVVDAIVDPSTSYSLPIRVYPSVR